MFKEQFSAQYEIQIYDWQKSIKETQLGRSPPNLRLVNSTCLHTDQALVQLSSIKYGPILGGCGSISGTSYSDPNFHCVALAIKFIHAN